MTGRVGKREKLKQPAELAPQLEQAEPEARFGRAEGRARQPGDLDLAQTAVIGQLQSLALCGGQAGEGGAHLLGELPALSLGVLPSCRKPCAVRQTARKTS